MFDPFNMCGYFICILLTVIIKKILKKRMIFKMFGDYNDVTWSVALNCYNEMKYKVSVFKKSMILLICVDIVAASCLLLS